MEGQFMCTDIEYHLGRARAERNIAYRTSHLGASDAHMSLSAMHLQRAMLLQEVRIVPVGNVVPFRAPLTSRLETDSPEMCIPDVDLQA
jgi:hypothetical protein